MTTTTILTRRQQSVYDFLLQQHGRHRPPPTLDELCEGLGLRSRGSMHKHVQALVGAGLVYPMEGKQRGVRVVPPPENVPEQLPLLGFIAAGQPIEAIENPEGIEVPERLRTERPCYVLQVKGDSMMDDGILDGDWVVIEQRAEARNGEIVVALVDRAEATLKRIGQHRGKVVLYPANSRMKPMTFSPDRIQIQGVVVGQMRTYR